MLNNHIQKTLMSQTQLLNSCDQLMRQRKWKFPSYPKRRVQIHDSMRQRKNFPKLPKERRVQIHNSSGKKSKRKTLKLLGIIYPRDLNI